MRPKLFFIKKIFILLFFCITSFFSITIAPTDSGELTIGINNTPEVAYANGAAANQAAAQSNGASSNSKKSTVDDEKAPKWWSAEAIANALVSRVISFGIKLFSVFVLGIAFLTSYITAWAVGFATVALDVGVAISLQGFSDMMNGDIGIAIQNAWEIFRDLGNIGLVFILLYIAINTIIQAGSFQTKKLLGSTIMVAILINFSYLATTIVIDVANIMAESINTSIDEKLDGKGLGTYIHENTKMSDITTTAQGEADVPAEGTSPQQFNEKVNANKDNATFDDQVVTWATSYALLTILNLVIIVVFLVATIMLITRVIILMFLLVLSPIGFISGILPNTKKMSDEWWGALINNAFFMPIFLLFVYVAITIIESGGLAQLQALGDVSVNNNKGTAELTKTISNIIAPMVQYSIVIGLFIAALAVSRKMSMGGGGIASKVSGSITTSIGKGAIGAGAFAGRNTVGWGANKLANSEGVQRFANKYRSFGGTQVLKGVRGVAGSSFDARGSGAFKGVASATGVGNDFGKAGGKGGYSKALDTRATNRSKFNKEAFNYEISENEALDTGFAEDQRSELAEANQKLQDAQLSGDAKLITAAEKSQKVKKKKFDAKIEQIMKSGGKYQDAKNLQNSKGDFWQKGRNKKATEKILKELGKGDNDKRFDKLEKLIKDSSKDD